MVPPAARACVCVCVFGGGGECCKRGCCHLAADVLASMHSGGVFKLLAYQGMSCDLRTSYLWPSAPESLYQQRLSGQAPVLCYSLLWRFTAIPSVRYTFPHTAHRTISYTHYNGTLQQYTTTVHYARTLSATQNDFTHIRMYRAGVVGRRWRAHRQHSSAAVPMMSGDGVAATDSGRLLANIR